MSTKSIATIPVPLIQWDKDSRVLVIVDADVLIEQDDRTGCTEFYATDSEGDAVDLPDAAYEVLLEFLENPAGFGS